MSSNRIRKLSLLALLGLAIAGFGYFAFGRRQPRHEAAVAQATAGKDVYYCPMHKDYHSDKPGNCPICSMKLIKVEGPGEAAPASEPATAPPPVAQENAIFVPPEKQQLIGMRSVAAEMGTLTKEIRVVGKVSYDETRLTHIHLRTGFWR